MAVQIIEMNKITIKRLHNEPQGPLILNDQVEELEKTITHKGAVRMFE